jgi:glycerol-1-phosphate dehydrogenase [NAD(P)+]
MHGEPLDDFACLTSEAAALSVLDETADITEDDFRQKLIRGLILSGVAMEMAGSSRPASGSEHLVSHALDQILPRPGAHGLQVAIGSVAAGILRDDDVESLVAFHRQVGLPVVPGDLGIAVDDFMEAVRLGPSMRPGRATCLDEVTGADLGRLRRWFEREAG